MRAAGFARLDGDDQAAVGKRRVVAALAHAVGAEVAGIADAGHHVAAGAHAEREEVAAAGADRRAVIGGAQGRVAGRRSVARPVDRRLRLFDPHAELKRLGLHRHAAAQQHAVGVAGAVADGQDRQRRRRCNPTRSPGRGAGRRRCRGPRPGTKTEFRRPAPRTCAAASCTTSGQPVGAQVRPVFVDDRRLAVTVGEDFQDAGARRARCRAR